MQKRYGILATILLAYFFSWSQELTFNHITREDRIGLTSDKIFCTYQDQKGFIWVGTANGLQRFDGIKFIQFSYSRPAPGQLPLTPVKYIVPADNDKLWLFLEEEKKIGLFDTKNFSFKEVPIENADSLSQKKYTIRLYRDNRGAILLFIWRYGILKFDAAKNKFIKSNYLPLPEGWISTTYFFEDSINGRFWLPCSDSGLAVYDIRAGKTYTARYNPKNIPLLNNAEIQSGITEVFIDSHRRHWMFSWKGSHIYRCFDEKGNPLKDTSGVHANKEYSELRYFYETSNKTVWMYGLNCLYSTDNKNRRLIFYPQDGNALGASIRYSTINHIMEDNDGLLWLSTDNGLYYTAANAGNIDVVNMLVKNDKTNVEITDILELKSGQYWLSTWGDAIITLTKNFQRYDAGIYKNIPHMEYENFIQYRQTWSLFQDKKGMVWIGCQAGRYMLFDTATKKTIFSIIPEAENATIRYITEDKKGNIWIGTQRGHIIRYDGKKFTTLQQYGTVIKKILVDNEGLIWIATEAQGVHCLDADGKQLRQYRRTNSAGGLYIDFTSDLDQLNDSVIVCAAGALNFINKRTGEIKYVTFDEGLPGNSALRVRIDNKGYLWTNTSDGLCRYNPFSGTVTQYGKKDGIEFERHTIAADFLSSEGYIMFAGQSHFLFFKPSIFEDKKIPPDITITDFRLHGKYIPLDSLLRHSQIELKNDKNSFTIDFSSLSFLQRDKLVYYYRMKGVSDEWRKADKQTSVSYTLLPPGKYTFEVYAENIDGLRSSNISSLKIMIQPPFWRTGWFITTLLTIMGMIAYIMHRLRINKILAVEFIRNRVARDLHDDMGSTLSTINILSSMAKAKLNTDSIKTAEYINKISDNSQRMMEAMDDIVWAIKPANDSMHKVVARMREFATNVFEAKNIELDFKVTEEVNDVQLDMEGRRDFFLFFKEAVNNAAKYSKCSKADINLFIENKKLKLIVQDNGIGFNVKTADGGNGLGNMQKRADALKGLLKIQSKPGEGTTVSIYIPVN